MKKTVIVAMSGGVDSAAAAILLQKQNFNVQGVFMKLLHSSYFQESEINAKKIAKILKIPFFVIDLRKEFKKQVIDCFIKEQNLGITANPCVLCNKEIKFRILLEKLKDLNKKFDFIATGHYARVKQENNNFGKNRRKTEENVYKLLSAKDENKDQTYFLWTLGQEQLKQVLFPVGDYTKKKVKDLVKKFNIFNLVKSESKDICFIENNINDFFRKNIKFNAGKILDVNNKIIGEHQGLVFYTIGQRKTIKLSGGPYYVLNKDIKKNILTVTRNEKDLYKKELTIKNVNWISGKEINFSMKIKVKIRYRQKAAEIKSVKKQDFSEKGNKKYKLFFSEPQRAITQGQSVVFYSGKQVLGGGIIE